MSLTKRTRMYKIETVDGNIEFDYINTNLNDMELTTVDKVRVNAVFERRPDLLSYKYFGNFDLGWLIAYHNNFLDPVEDLVVGVVVDIPSIDDFYRFASRNAKNKKTQRTRR